MMTRRRDNLRLPASNFSAFFLGLLIVVAVFIQDCLSVEVQVSPAEALVLPGQNVTFMCRAPVGLQYCRVEIPGRGSYNLNPQISTETVKYFGSGLNTGQCGFKIDRIELRNNGIVQCFLGIASETQEARAKISLIVAKRPDLPILDFLENQDRVRDYKIHDPLLASCVVGNGRPAANISWYLDNQPIFEGLSMPTVVDLAKENLQSKIQNLTRQVQATDNGKKLRCVAYHPGYPNGAAEASRTLFIKYGPQPYQEEPIEQFGFQLGKEGVISLVIEANPKPKIEWQVADQLIRESNTDNTGRIVAEAPRDDGQGRYLVNLRIGGINKGDTEKQYILTAYNELGRTQYRVRISTNQEPEGVELGVGPIIGIVIAVCLVFIIVFLIIFAKRTGRWCFSGGATVIDYTTGDNGNHHNHHHNQRHLHSGGGGDGVDNPHHQISQEYINGNDLPIKKDEKINTPV